MALWVHDAVPVSKPRFATRLTPAAVPCWDTVKEFPPIVRVPTLELLPVFDETA